MACAWTERLIMAVYNLCQVPLETAIELRFRAMSFRQRDRFGKQAARMGFRSTHHRYWPRIVFNNDFSARPHVGQQLRNIGRSGFLLRDVDHILGHNPNYTSRQA